MKMTEDTSMIVEAVKLGKKLSPNAMGRLVDALKAHEADRLAQDKLAEAAKQTEVMVRAALLTAMQVQDVKAIGGKAYTCELKQEDQPTVKDWPMFYAYIMKMKAFDLLERRPSKAAVKERWADGKTIPGVEKFPVDKLSFSKLKG